MKGILLFIGLFCFASAWTQDVKSVLTKVNATYANKNVSYSTKYELYKGHKATKIHSFYTGEVVSQDGNIYQKIDKTEFIYTEKFSVKINSDEKALVVLAGQKNISPELNLELALKECSSSELVDKGSYYSIVMIMKPASSLQCSVIQLRVDKESFTLQQIDVYYSFLQDFSAVYTQQDLNQPHMKIKFTNMNLNASAKTGLFSQSSYYSIDNSVLKAIGKYATYILHDNR